MSSYYTPLSQPRYELLDGLRGVAALLVLGYHLFEAVAFAQGAPEQNMYHGFLAVDFFFVLSGFVMGYAYDRQWDHMSIGTFIRRRLTRLHPMVVGGVLLGLVCFIIQGCTRWDGSQVSLSVLLWSTLLALFLLPSPDALDVRGNTEAFPLNGPHWSLFFEYIASLFYALFLHRFKDKWLFVWVFLAGIALFLNGFLSSQGDIAYGWSSEPNNLFGGLLRVSFSYPLGLLLSRHYKKTSEKGSFPFLLAALLLIAALSLPSFSHYDLSPMALRISRIGYQMLLLCVLFPFLLWIASQGSAKGRYTGPCIRFLGRLSYPLYAVHYPFIYLYIHWIETNQHPFGEAPWCSPVAVAVMSILAGTLFLLCWDEPIRRKLNRR